MKIIHIIHKGENRLKLEFDYDANIILQLKQKFNAKWSQTHRTWHVAYNDENIIALNQIFGVLYANNDLTFATKPSILSTNNSLTVIDKSKSAVPKTTNLQIAGKKIIVKTPKNDLDSKFILGIRFSYWDKANYQWIVPNYGENLELLKKYFAERINSITEAETLSINIETHQPIQIGKNEVLVYKTNSKRLRIAFGYAPGLNQFIKTLPYHKWDTSNKWWTVPFSEVILQDLKNTIINQNLIFTYQEETAKPKKVNKISPLEVVNYKKCPEEFSLKLIELRYSPKTLKTYQNCFKEFINYFPMQDIKTISEPSIIQFLRYLVMERKVSASYQNQAINAIKFYYEKVLGGQRKFYFIERPNREKALPEVLSTLEVTQILKNTVNLKHKAILSTIYSAGLRISEVVNLKIKDIDSDRMQLRIEQGKGKVDRYTLLSTKTLALLRQYYTQFKPKTWLFEGQKPNEPYSVRSIQIIFQEAVKKSGIIKNVSVHTLRHSFATHLLENGTDLRYIQNLLGHASSKTTEIYTHITTKGFDQIKSPIDNLDI